MAGVTRYKRKTSKGKTVNVTRKAGGSAPGTSGGYKNYGFKSKNYTPAARPQHKKALRSLEVGGGLWAAGVGAHMTGHHGVGDALMVGSAAASGKSIYHSVKRNKLIRGGVKGAGSPKDRHSHKFSH